MIKFIQLLSYLYSKLSLKDFSNQPIRNDIPVIVNRRNKPILLKSYSTKSMVIEALDKIIDEQIKSAHEKISQSYNWGITGHIEMYAISQVKQAIKSHHETNGPNNILVACHGSFEALINQWQHKIEDTDGYGLATIKFIKRTLEQKY